MFASDQLHNSKRLSSHQSSFWISLAASIVFSFCWWLFSAPWWLIVITLILVGVTALLVSRAKFSIRYHELRILSEVSAAQCTERFTQLIAYYCGSSKLWRDALSKLTPLVQLRGIPTGRVYRDVEMLASLASSQQTDAEDSGGRDIVGIYLARRTEKKKACRDEVAKNVAKYYRSNISSNAIIVLYGYSSTVCDTLVQNVTKVDVPIFLVYDRQYGAGSLREHELADAHLRRSGVNPTIVPFDQSRDLFAPDKYFVTDCDGTSAPLKQNRELFVIVGCEAADERGHVLVPSKRQGQTSETAFFLEECLRQTLAAGNGPKRHLVVVLESHKIVKTSFDGARKTFAPLNISVFQKIIYILFGVPIRPRLTPVEMVEIDASEIDVIIDDCGLHLASNGEINLRPSSAVWAKIVASLRNGFDNSVHGLLESVNVVVFDLNGVLADDEDIQYTAFSRTVRDYKSNMTHAEYLRMCFGLTDEEGARNLIDEKQLGCGVDEIVRKKREYYSSLVGDERDIAFSGAVEVVEQLERQGKQLFLVTSASLEEANAFLSKQGLDDAIPECRRQVEATAQSRGDAYKRVLQDCELQPMACVVIDDSAVNLKLARSLGFKTIGVAGESDLDIGSVDHVVESVEDLVRRDSD